MKASSGSCGSTAGRAPGAARTPQQGWGTEPALQVRNVLMPSQSWAPGAQGEAFIRQDKSWGILAYIKLVWEYLQTHGNKRQCLLTTHFSVILCKNTLIPE